MAELFGWEFKRKIELDPAPTFSPKETDDGALVVAAGGSFGTYVDLDGTVRTEAELVTKYREMSLQPECDSAIDEIVNETMSIDEKEIVNIDLDQLENVPERIKKAIRDEFLNCLNILDFNKHAYEIYRRWYIDVGNLPKMKAEQYVREIMVKHKNRLIYDAESGNIRDDRKFMTMLEDYWLPRREGGKGTEVTTLPGGQTLGQMDDVLYFQKKFFQTLNVPVNRLNSDALFSLGRATEVTRDELKFAKFISRLRGKFSGLFVKMLEKQLVLKQVMTIEDFENIAPSLKFDFSKDNYFTELKDGEIVENRINLARNLQDMVGKYYSQEWLRRNVLQQSDDDIEEMDKQIEEETNSGDPRWLDPNIMNNEMMSQQMGMEQGDGTDVQPLANDEDTDATPKTDEKNRKIQNAKSTYDLLTQKKNRTLSDEAKLKSATQILARNK